MSSQWMFAPVSALRWIGPQGVTESKTLRFRLPELYFGGLAAGNLESPESAEATTKV
jgi:hypothetical protein